MGNPLAGFARAMRHRDYRRYSISSLFSSIGTWTHRVAIGWLTWELTGSYAWLGIIAFTDLFAGMVAAPLAGEQADRMDRIKLSLIAQWAQLAQALMVAVMVFGGWIDRWSLLALTVVQGVAHAYHAGARLAVVPSLVPRDDLTPAIAINSLIFNISRFIGPALAGLIIVNLGIGPAFVFNALTFLYFIWVLMRITVVEPEHQAEKGGGVLGNIRDGVRYAVAHVGIGPMLLMLAVTSVTVRALPDLLPGFADGVFGRGAVGLAWLTSALGFGAMISGVVLLARDGIAGMTRVVFVSLLALGLFTFAFAVVDSFWLAVVAMVGVGLSMNLWGIGALNLIQNAVQGEMRGRVMSIYFFLHQGAPALGTLAIGGVAEYLGLGWPVGTAAVSIIALWVLMVGRVGRLRDALETERPARAGGD
ncbi:MAG: MFS transporter [Alphaproteobacteria bacterium]|nr:MFS transporter [Alphaproteobacteria bacterium]